MQKLLQLLWCDWHQAVRAAAAEALGRTAHGRDVHDSLLRQLGGSDERTRLLAIAHVGCLGERGEVNRGPSHSAMQMNNVFV